MRMHHHHTSFRHTIHNLCKCACMHARAFDNHNAQTRHVNNKVKYVTTQTGTSQHNDDHRTRHHVIIISSSKIIIANQSSSSSPSPQTASKPSFFHHHNHNRHHHNFQETLVTSRQRKHQRGKKNTAYQCQTKPIKTKIQFNKIKHAPHQNFTQHTSQSRFNAIAIAIAAKSNSGIRLQFVNNMHNSNKKRNLKAMQNQHRKSKLNAPITTNNRDRKTIERIKQVRHHHQFSYYSR